MLIVFSNDLTHNVLEGWPTVLASASQLLSCSVSVVLCGFSFRSVSSLLFSLEEGCGEPWFPAWRFDFGRQAGLVGGFFGVVAAVVAARWWAVLWWRR